MKKSITVFGTMVFAALTLTSCGKSVEGDAKKLAEIQCKTSKLAAKAFSEDITAESAALEAEADKIYKEMKEKYTTDEEKQELQEAVAKELGNCE